MAWTQPVLTANGTIGTSRFAVQSGGGAASDAYKAFDSSTSSYVNKMNSGAWLIFYSATRLNISDILITSNGSLPSQGIFQVSDDDGETWTQCGSWEDTDGLGQSAHVVFDDGFVVGNYFRFVSQGKSLAKPNNNADFCNVQITADSVPSGVFFADVECKISAPVKFSCDVRRKVDERWQYQNAGNADSLIVEGTTLTDLPKTKSVTGTAFYQTTQAKCFDIPATDEIWIKFDVYFGSSVVWRAFNGGTNGNCGVMSYSTDDLRFYSNGSSKKISSDVLTKNGLQTVLLHMISDSTAGVVEAWVDGEFVYRFVGNVNKGENFADFYLQSNSSSTFFSNVIISNLELGFGDGYQVLSCDIERKVSAPVEISCDVSRKVIHKWLYENLGTADTLIIEGETLNDLPETQSRTGTAFYQTAREKCFDLPATDEIWIKFDVYFDGSNRWRAYNDKGGGTLDGISAQQTSSATGTLSFFASTNQSIYQGENVTKKNQLQTVLLHMVSGTTNGIVEAWVDGSLIYTYAGDVNKGEDFADIYLQSDGEGTFFSNVIISNAEVGLNDGYQTITLDIERKVAAPVEIFCDIQLTVTIPVVVPFIGEHFNHLVPCLSLPRGSGQIFILPKSGEVYVSGTCASILKISSDNETKIVGDNFFYDNKVFVEFDQCENIFVEMYSFATPQCVIKAFMEYLNDSTVGATNTTVDEAINYSTGGKFATRDLLVNKFFSDLDASISAEDFLETYCDIILGNADTGAISGSDAGGTTKTAESVVPEPLPVKDWVMPRAGSSTIIEGLTVRWPLQSVNGGYFTAAEKHVLAGLNSVWIEQSLKLIEASFGLSFKSDDVFVKEISVTFINDSNRANILASVNYEYNGGKATYLSLTVNMYHYKNIYLTSEDGATSVSSAGYLDRTIAHEFTHAVMAANIYHFSNLPNFIKEGSAELIHGIDDLRGGGFETLLTTERDTLESILRGNLNPTGEKSYIAGYIFLRYLAKQGQNSTASYIPTEVHVSNLLISDGDYTQQNFYPDVECELITSVNLPLDVEVRDVVHADFLADVERSLLTNLALYPMNSEDFFSDETNPFVVRKPTLFAAKKKLRAENTWKPQSKFSNANNTAGLQSFEVSIAEQQITDQVRIATVKPIELRTAVRGQYLDYKYKLHTERVQKQGMIYYCDCYTDLNAFLYSQLQYRLPAETTWTTGDGKTEDEQQKTTTITTVFPKATTHARNIAAAVALKPDIRFDEFLSTVLMEEKGGVTYNDLIRDIFGWSARVPTMLINVFIRDNKLCFVQRGKELHTIDISSATMTEPVITQELVRIFWSASVESKTETKETKSTRNVPADKEEGDDSSGGDSSVGKTMDNTVEFKGTDSDGKTTYTYDSKGLLREVHSVLNQHSTGTTVETTIEYEYDKDGTQIKAETHSKSTTNGKTTTYRNIDKKDYNTLATGEKYLYQEHSVKYENDVLVDERIVVHSPTRVGQTHVTSINGDGVVGEAGGQHSGDERVTPYRFVNASTLAYHYDEKKNAWVPELEIKTTTKSTTTYALSLYDMSFPIHDTSTLTLITKEMQKLNGKVKETVNVTIYDFPHLIDFNDLVVLNGTKYYLSSNTARTTPKILSEQNLTLVRWYELWPLESKLDEKFERPEQEE